MQNPKTKNVKITKAKFLDPMQKPDLSSGSQEEKDTHEIVCTTEQEATFEQTNNGLPSHTAPLKRWQVGCMQDYKLTTDQVTAPWFTIQHAFAIETENVSYDDIQGLNVTQIKGLLAGLTLEQVKPFWFKSTHLHAIEDGVSYESIRELSIKEVEELQALASKKEIERYRAALFSGSSSYVATSFARDVAEENKVPPTPIILSAQKSELQKEQEALDAAMAARLQAEYDAQEHMYLHGTTVHDVPH